MNHGFLTVLPTLIDFIITLTIKKRFTKSVSKDLQSGFEFFRPEHLSVQVKIRFCETEIGTRWKMVSIFARSIGTDPFLVEAESFFVHPH